jgi:hypothetical protein
VVDGVGAQRWRRSDLSWSESGSRALWSSGTCAQGERWGEMAWHRCSGRKQRRCSSDGLPEGGSVGGADKMNGMVLFNSCEHKPMPGSRRRTFGRVSSASGAGGARLHRRAPGAGIPAGAVTGSSRAVGSGDGTPWCTTADVMAQGSRRTRGHPCDGGVVMGGWPVTGNLVGVATRASRGGEIWGKRRLTSGPHLSVMMTW